METNTYQYISTHRGLKWMEPKSREEEIEGDSRMSPGQIRQDELRRDIFQYVDGALDRSIETQREMGALNWLLRRGYIEREARTVEQIIADLPLGSGLRELLGIYNRIAKQRRVTADEIEWLRKKLLLGMHKQGFIYGAETVTDLLESAKTKSEKIIAIDTAMSIAHGGNSALLLGIYEESDPSGLGAEREEEVVQRVSNKLRYE